MIYKKWGKRWVDVAVSLILLICAMPVMVVVGVSLFRVNNGATFFYQKRPGKGGRPFTIVKFKTMNDAVDRHGRLLDDESRMTRVGRMVRKSSIDELPQLLNVLKGDMSLIGPRPLLMQYLERYSPEQARRHEVKPGITGWAQVNGRNALSWKEKFEHDVWYVDHQSLMLDMKIIMMTVLKVIQRDGISQDGHATAEEFMGGDDG